MEDQQKRKINLDSLRHLKEQRFDIRIAPDGRWFHEGGEIFRIELVKLFASILFCDDDGDYWLATPAEKGRIKVEDVPFVVIDMAITIGDISKSNEIVFLTSLDDKIVLDEKCPLQLVYSKRSRDLRPYIEVRDGLLARLSRPVYYQLAEYAEEGPNGKLGVWSHQHFFDLES
ncbi:DUF1285 domain-containing protein [Candidatus Puniceispirillum sp.]|nr:DUF1285 domain-containing protein [Candidatus Puniceispirillum sp.]